MSIVSAALKAGKAVGKMAKDNAGKTLAGAGVLATAGAMAHDTVDDSDATPTEKKLDGGSVRISLPAASKYKDDFIKHYSQFGEPQVADNGDVTFTLGAREYARATGSPEPTKET